MKLLVFPESDVVLSRLETVQNTLILYCQHNENEEAAKCLDKVREAICWYNMAFDGGQEILEAVTEDAD